MKRFYINEVKPTSKQVLIKGWVERIKIFGQLAFIILRDSTGKIQCVVSKKNIPSFQDLKEITKESVIEVQGTAKKSKIAKKGYEIAVKKFKVLSKAATPLPIDVEKSHTQLDKRLDYRFLDLRRHEIQAVFKIQSKILQAFREYFTKNKFTEIVTPTIISESSEGGTDVFKVKYFEKEAFLAQSPQLYKQMAIASGLDKVFIIGPVFRAEKHNTTKHLNESRQLDIEVGFSDHNDVMKDLEEVLVYIIKKVKQDCKKELNLLKRDLKIPKLPLKRLTYAQVCKKIKLKYGKDLGSDEEKKICSIIKEPFFITSWPLEMKPFYAMPSSKDPKLSNSFDLMWDVEISSGAQRIHIPSLLYERLKAKKLKPKEFKTYTDAFVYGCPKHAGWAIGLERLTMIICGLKNIREACLWPRDRDRIKP